MDSDRLYRAAVAYIARGWHVFTVRKDKIPFRNCEKCPLGAGHSGLECECLRCHGHLAATRDESRVAQMIAIAQGDCSLAIATGASGLVVVDAEGDDRTGYGQTGLEVLDQLELWDRALPARGHTLRAWTSGGGLHLFYRGSEASTNRLLPGVDIKSRGGFVVVPPAFGRRWEDWQVPMASWDGKVFGMVGSKAVHSTGVLGGSSVLSQVAEGAVVPDGIRYEYTRDLVYKLRKQGVSWEDAVAVARSAWLCYAQPPAARYEMPWSRVQYELDRAWQRVTPDALDPAHEDWLTWLRSKQ